MAYKMNALRILGLLAMMVGMGVGVAPVNSQYVAYEVEDTIETEGTILEPDLESDVADVAPLSETEREALYEKVLAVRESFDLQVDNNPVSEPSRLDAQVGSPTVIGLGGYLGDAYLPYAANTFTYFNHKNTRANTAGNSTLAEPAAVNEGIHTFYAGNWHSEYSTNRGATWTNVAIPAGPVDAPYGCCDPDVVYDPSRGITIFSYLYVNSGVTNGVVKLYVRRSIPGGTACSYTIDPAGTANDTLPDYPHLGLSNNYLYLATNNLGGAAGNRAQLRRFSLDEMANCTGTPTEMFTYLYTQYGQRVFVPVEGATDTMYWGLLQTSNSFRIYTWPESSTTATSALKTVDTTNFANSDCRGGYGNHDWIEGSTSYSSAGFRLRGAIGKNNILWLWNAGADASHVQAHVHAALFRENDQVLIGQPHIWNPSYCFGYPALASNIRGDFGLSIAAGGQAGGGGTAAIGYVAMDDEYTPGIGNFQTIYRTAYGNYNRTDDRFGDYFTVRRWNPSGLYFAATNYALWGGTATANVNARYVEFGRGRDFNSFFAWRSRAPNK